MSGDPLFASDVRHPDWSAYIGMLLSASSVVQIRKGAIAGIAEIGDLRADQDRG